MLGIGSLTAQPRIWVSTVMLEASMLTIAIQWNSLAVVRQQLRRSKYQN
jgi:hypothetical protein